MKNPSTWRSVRRWEGAIAQDLHRRHWLRLHGLCIGTLVLAAMWGAAHLQMLWGGESLALRYLVTLGVGYGVYLLTLRLWAAALIKRDARGSGVDGGLPDFGVSLPPPGAMGQGSGFRTGGGGNFGGGGASGEYSGAASLGTTDHADAADLASGALDVASGADDGAIVVVPVVAVFLIGLALVFGVGSLLMLYFGWEALLAVAIELSFTYVSARTAVRLAREGWLSVAVRLTYKPMLGALLCAVLLGAVIDHFLPTAQSLPQAIRLIQQSR